MEDIIAAKAGAQTKLASAQSVLCNWLAVKPEKIKAIAAAIVTTSFFCALLATWLSFDNHAATCDEANHVMNGLTYSDLLQHARPLRPDWWRKFFTVNTYYPPVGTLLYGIGFNLFQSHTFALQAIKVFWLALLSLSVGLIAFTVSGSCLAVALSISLVNLCSITCDLSHTALLDMPLVAMVATGLAAIYWKSHSSCWSRSFITGIILALAIMTKQVAIAFLGFPLVLNAILTLKTNWNKRGLVSIGLMTLPIIAICAPWVILNYASMNKQNLEIAVELSKRGSTLSRVLFNLEYYLGSAIFCASPIVLLVSLLGFLKITPAQNRQLATLWFAIVPAATALCIISCQPARDRYIAPIVVLIAVIGGVALAQLKEKNMKFFWSIVILTVPLLCVQFASYNFSPFPLNARWLNEASKLTGGVAREHVSPFFNKNDSIVVYAHSNPIKDNSSLAHIILKTINEIDGQSASWLNITVYNSELDVHELELLAKLQKYMVQPTTSRRWTALGDLESFSEISAANYRWYVLRDGDQGFRFANRESILAHEQLIQFVKRHYTLIKQLKASDGENIGLYCSK
jgi:4-amino-4-deoxy-L-arabinose transferase-like glycosyltransferase